MKSSLGYTVTLCLKKSSQKPRDIRWANIPETSVMKTSSCVFALKTYLMSCWTLLSNVFCVVLKSSLVQTPEHKVCSLSRELQMTGFSLGSLQLHWEDFPSTCIPRNSIFSGIIETERKRGQANWVAYKGRWALWEMRRLENREEVTAQHGANHRLAHAGESSLLTSIQRLREARGLGMSRPCRGKPCGNIRNSALHRGPQVLFAALTAQERRNLPHPLPVCSRKSRETY